MATYLYRLGGWAFTNRRKVLFGWLAILAVVIGCAASFSGQFSSKFEVPGTESQDAQDLLREKFPGAGGASGGHEGRARPKSLCRPRRPPDQ